MFSASVIDPEIIQAYLETHYHVHGGAPAILRVGEASASLAALHDASGVKCSTFMTAWNPFSRQATDEADNARRQAALASELAQRGLTFIDGIGQHPSNAWPGEPSFLVLGLALEDAKALGARHEQNAIIWSGADAVPQLILLR